MLAGRPNHSPLEPRQQQRHEAGYQTHRLFKEQLQQHLQPRSRKLPSWQLYRFEVQRSGPQRRARVVLQAASQQLASGVTLPWSQYSSTRHQAKEEALELAYRTLVNPDDTRHDSTVHDPSASTTPRAFLTRSRQFKKHLPKLALLLQLQQRWLYRYSNFWACHQGRLGEEFACAWLERQSFVVPNSVLWINRDREMTRSYDLEMRLKGVPGPCFVEVKSRWRGYNAAVSITQDAQLRDPSITYMVVIVGDMCNLFQNPPKPPTITMRVAQHAWLSSAQ